jgi:hypothetical protein
MSDGDGGYYFDQQAADDAAYQSNMLALEAQSQAPAPDINSLYQDLLGRAPDPTGIAAYAGASADTIRQSILSSPEYNNQNINTIYQDLLGRAPDPTGIAAYAGATPEQIRQSIFGSAEYQNQAPPSGFFDMPGYGAESADPYSIVGNMLMQGNQLVYNVAPIQDDNGYVSGYKRADTGEGVDLNKLNKSITGYDSDITNLYENLLGRAPDVSEVIAYNDRLKSGEIDFNDVIKGFTSSPEYLNKTMPFLDPNADVNTKFEQGVRGFDAKGLVRGGALEGLPTHYFDPKTGKLAAWFGTNDGLTGTDNYTWHTAAEAKLPGAELRLAEESRRDVGKDWRTLGTKAATIYASVAMPALMAYAGPAMAAAELGVTAAEFSVMAAEAGMTAAELASTVGTSFSTGSGLADSAIQSALMQGGKSALSGGDFGDILKSAGIGAATSAAGDLASDAFKDFASEYLSGGLSDAQANALMGDYTNSANYSDYIDARSVGDSGVDWRNGDGSGVHEGYGGNIDGGASDPNEYVYYKDADGNEVYGPRSMMPSLSGAGNSAGAYNPTAPYDAPFQPQLPAAEYAPVVGALQNAGADIVYTDLANLTQDPGALIDSVYPILAGRPPTAQERLNFIDQYSNSNTTSPQDLLKDIYDQIQLDKQVPVFLDQPTPVVPPVTPVVTKPVEVKPVETKPDETKPTEKEAGGGGGGGTTGAPSPSAAPTAAPSPALDQWFADNIVGEFEPIDYIAAPDGVKRELADKNYVDNNGYLTPRGRQILAGVGTGGVGSGGTGTAPGIGGPGGTGGGTGGGIGGGSGPGGTGGGIGGGSGPGGTGGGIGGGSGPGGTAAAKKAAAKKAADLKFNQSLNQALQAVQGISAKTPPGAEIDYLYDIGGDSIFAPMKAQSKYQPRESYYDPKVERGMAQGGMVAFDEGGDVAEVKPYDATVRDKYAQGLQEIIEGLGAEKGYARGVTRSITGGEGSKFPLGLGVSDFVPFLGTGMQTQEAVRSGEAAIDSIKRGEYGRAAIEGGLGLLGLVPGLGGTARVLNSKLVQNMGRAGEKYGERVLPQIMDRGGLPAELLKAMATGTQSKMLIGSKAAGIDPAELKYAKEMLENGVSPKEIWGTLLWAKAPDGRMVKFHSTANANMLPMDELLQKQADTIYKNTTDNSGYLDASLIAKKIEQGMSEADAIKWFETELGRPPIGNIQTLLDYGGDSKNLRQLYNIELQNADLEKGLKLEDVYNDPEIFKHYPALKDVEFRIEPDNPNYGGYYSAGDQQIAATPHNLNYAPKELTVHELSHAINDLEGRPRGANVRGIEQSPEYYSQAVDDANNKLIEAHARMYATHPWMSGMPPEYIDREIRRMPEFIKYLEEVDKFMGGKTPKEMYMRELGEAEARMAEYMKDMTPNQARTFYPFDPQNFETATGVPLSETWHKSHGGIIDLLRSK